MIHFRCLVEKNASDLLALALLYSIDSIQTG